ncbi:MFS transporter [Candidatus Saccharibacteria bacterium]|nr:MFS transporter [Candidatus Saccharibacteria bacterium]
MKTFKKASWALLLLALVGAFFLFKAPLASAVEPSDVDSCAWDAIAHLHNSEVDSNSRCKFFQDGANSACGLHQLYDDGNIKADYLENNVGYQLPYSAAGFDNYSIDKNGKLNKPLPETIKLYDLSTNQAVTSTHLTVPTFHVMGSSTNPKGGNVAGFSDSYFMYVSDYNPDFILLISVRTSSNPPIVLALVNAGKNAQNKDFPKCASRINKAASLSTSTGTPVDPAANPDTAGNVSKGDPCSKGADCKDNICQKTDGDCSTGTCESNFIHPFSWIVCPALGYTDQMIQGIYGQVEDMLCFNTGDSNLIQTGTQSSTGGVVCEGPNSLVNGVKASWNIFKNIASALLVIVMLIMVISQAIGGGLFDAYTIRKMLPKLVAAVILMQLSFLLLKYAIDLSNDAGSAIGQIMMAPFGGVDNMNLGDMIGKGVHVATGSSGGQVAFNLFATVAAIGGAVYAIPALPLLAFYVFLGVFIAFFVLVLRKLLIIMLVILAPLAFIAWVLPGTDRYWKLWRDNLIKLLAMFPLIMAMLSAGRIVAYITSQAGSGASMFVPKLGVAHIGSIPVPYVASVTGFADLAIIVGAYFAPYYLLPKTFSWGGQLLSQAGKQVESLTKKGSEPAKNFLKEREKGYRAERRRKSQERVAAGQDTFRTLNPVKWGTSTVDKLRSGKWDPTLGRPRFIAGGSRRRQDALAAYVAAGAKSEEEEVGNANTLLQQRLEYLDERHGITKDDVVRAIANNDSKFRYQTTDGKWHSVGHISDADRRAALDTLVRLGGASNLRAVQDVVEGLEQEGGDSLVMRSKFLNAQAQNLFPKIPHLYKGVHSTIDGLSAEDLTRMDGTAMETLLGRLTQRLQLNPGDTQAADDLAKLTDTFHAAATNEATANRLPAGVSKAMKAFADDSAAGLLNSLNVERGTIGNPEIVTNDILRGVVEARRPGEIANISRIVTEGGVINTSAAGAPTPPPTVIPAANLDTPDATGWTPREQAFAENATRNEYNAYRTRVDRSAADPVAYPPLTSPEQQRFDQIRSTHPDW